MGIKNYDRITPERRKILINMCIHVILQQLENKTQEQLEQNKSGLLLKSSYDCFKRGDLVAQRQEEDLINSICEELYKRKELGKQAKKIEQEKIASELYEKFGIELPETNKQQDEHEEKQAKRRSSKQEIEVNFSALYNPQALKRMDNQRKHPIQYMSIPHSKTENHIFEMKNGVITIKKIGELNYHTLNGESYLHEYLVTKQDEKAAIIEVEKVYTDILIARMESDSQYKEMILKQLLSERNLHLPKSHGHIGKVTINWGEKKELRDYKLEYLPEEYTAVVELQRIRQEKRKVEEQVK